MKAATGAHMQACTHLLQSEQCWLVLKLVVQAAPELFQTLTFAPCLFVFQQLPTAQYPLHLLQNLINWVYCLSLSKAQVWVH